jgi:peptide/nickel transport system substrate-binding protein
VGNLIPVVDDQKKRQLRRGYKRRKKNAVDMGHRADEQIEKFLIGRFERLTVVRRFIFLWSALFVILILITLTQIKALGPYYQTLRPVAGGIFSEGMVGKFTNANPLYATGAANTSISHLIFSGLFKYDNNNQLAGDLANDWKISTDQMRYVVHLRHNVTWQDGQPFNANDVLFTYQTIQNPEAQSPLYSSWQGIKVLKLDQYTVEFDLPNPLSSFPYSMTNGIIPEHSFNNIKPVQMRSALFNTQPIGTGPFEWKFIEVSGSTSADLQQRILLAAFDKYTAGRPKLDGFNITVFPDDKTMQNAFNKKQLNAMSGLDAVPEGLKNDKGVHVYNTPLSSEVMAFFNNSKPVLNDPAVRRAMVSAVDRRQISSLLDYPVKAANAPLLPSQLGYDPSATQLAYDQAAAGQFLDKGGWLKGDDGMRSKGKQQLHLTLAAQDTAEFTQVAHFLQKQWGNLGIKVDVNYYSAEDLQNSIISNHDYDILLYGISLGVDPDVFAFWDSTQASTSSQGHLNLSEYKSKTADQALEAGRTRSDAALRTTKYKIFLTAWSQDAPALALYQPNFLYISRGPVFNYERKEINTSAERFSNVQGWMIRQRHQSL